MRDQLHSPLQQSAFQNDEPEKETAGQTLAPPPFAIMASTPPPPVQRIEVEQEEEESVALEPAPEEQGPQAVDDGNNGDGNTPPPPTDQGQGGNTPPPASPNDGAGDTPVEAPLAEMPQAEVPVTETPQAATPEAESPAGETPETESPEAPAALEPQVPVAQTEGANTGGNGGNNGGAGGGGMGGGGGLGGGMEAGGFVQEAPALDTSNMGGVVKSLASQQPTAIVVAMGGLQNDLSTAKQNEITTIEGTLPEIQQPTGLGSTVEGPGLIETGLTAEAPAEIGTNEQGNEQQVPTDHPQAQGPTPADRVRTPATLPSPQALSSAVANIPGSDPSINTSAGPRPQVQLAGDTDPQRNAVAQTQAGTEVQGEKNTADQETLRNFGEGEIMPEVTPEMMSPATEFPNGSDFSANAGVLPELDPKTASALNSGILTEYSDELSGGLEQQAAGELEFTTSVQTEQDKALVDIETENEKIRQQQVEAKAQGTAEINRQRDAWKAENAGVMAEFDNQSASKRQEIDQQIQSKVAETNTQVANEFTRAEREASAKTAEAERQVAAKKEEARKKEEDKSWWDSICDAVSSFFDAIKQAISDIFDALRSAVTAIIEGAKQLACTLIDMARDAIKGLIDVFAEALKTFVRIALAAFPEIAERFCALIDQAVEQVKQAVDALAEGLKTVVQFILDALGDAIIAYLNIYESIINAVLDAYEFLVLAWIKIMKGIANLVAAAIDMPSHFFGQASEEFLGQDVTLPLQNEYPADAVPAVAPVMEAGVPTDLVEETVDTMAPDIDASAQALLAQDGYTENDFDVPVLENEAIGPELQQQFAALGDGEHEFAQFNDSEHGIDALRAEFGGGEATAEAPSAEGGVPDAPMASEAVTEAPVAEAPAVAPADPSRDRFTPDANGMVGPFSTGERLQFVGKQMVDAIKKWFSENWPTILAVLIGVIGGAILLNILTGGAIMAALPLVMQLLSAYFAADALINMAKYMGQYLVKAFPGDITGGAKAMARGLAIGAIELVFALAFGGKAALKTMKTLYKSAAKGGVKGLAKTSARMAKVTAKQTLRSGVKLAKVGAKGLKTAGRNLIKGGKFAMNGLKRGAIAGAKSLDDLGQRLGRFFKFDKFKVRINGFRWSLLGHMNPWVLLANGDLKNVKKTDIDDLPGNTGRGAGTPVKVKIDDGTGKMVDVDAIMMPSKNNRALIDALQQDPAFLADLNRLLRTPAVRTDEILSVLNKMSPADAKQLTRQLLDHSTDIQGKLAAEVNRLRQSTGITKIDPKTGDTVGGTIGVGQVRINGMDPNDFYKGASSNAQPVKPPQHHQGRYAYQGHDVGKNHAEQTILGTMADKIDETFGLKGVKGPKSSVTGEVHINVDQAVCSACGQGLADPKMLPGVVRQFSEEFPNLTLILSAADTTRLMVVKAGKLIL